MDSPGFTKKIFDSTNRFERANDYCAIQNSIVKYKAYDTTTGLEVTWSEFWMKEDKDIIPKIEARLVQVQKLKHQQMANMLHHWKSFDGHLFWVTESTFNNCVYDIMKQGLIETRATVISRWFLPVLNVLDYLHSQSPPIVHGEISVRTIFAKPNGLVKVAAPSIMIDSLTKGIDPCMPPELLDGIIDTDNDIWQLGLALLTCACGKPPYSECGTTRELFQKLTCYQPPDGLSQVSDPRLREVISMCLKPKGQRPTVKEIKSHPYFQPMPSGDTSPTSKAQNDLVVIYSGKPTKPA